MERERLGEQPQRPAQAQAAHRYARLQSRRAREDSGPLRTEGFEEAVLLLLLRSAAGAEARTDPSVSDADRGRAAGGLLADARRERTCDVHQGSEPPGRMQR